MKKPLLAITLDWTSFFGVDDKDATATDGLIDDNDDTDDNDADGVVAVAVAAVAVAVAVDDDNA